ncbi:sigma-70 family RNA polymerase sigma factor [bacterium]|nr:sigma-70 family RNA polymerase sigma factor [bacterium]
MPQSEPSDESLLARLRSGDDEALPALVNRYQRPLFGYLHRMLGCAAEAEDIFQETFLRVVKHRARFETGRRVRPWVYAIASNLVKNVYRSRGYRERTSLDRGDQDGGPGLRASIEAFSLAPEDEASNAERAERVREAIARLSPTSRDALVLFYYQGLPYEEIAETLDVPLGTVKSRIHNALSKLAGLIAEACGNAARSEAEHA